MKMTPEEIITEIRQLPLDERLRILETLSRDIRSSVQTANRKGTPVERVSGLLETDAPAPTDEELKRDYIDYLDSKYS
jgi:hypothetical protein